MSAGRLIVLIVAGIAALGALLLIRGMGSNRHEPQAQADAIPGEQILVAAHDIPQGAQIQASDLSGALFPQASTNAQFVRAAQQGDYVGAVTRRSFLAGEPIVQGSLVQPNGAGFMAAELQPGFRAVAVEVEPKTGAGGYIQPNDHVDVILTRHIQATGSAPEQIRTETVLSDVRVLALDDKMQTQATGQAPERIEADVAVLELSSQDARLLAQADAMGDLSLALRSVENETADLAAPSSGRGARALGEQSEAIRVHAFGSVSDGASR